MKQFNTAQQIYLHYFKVDLLQLLNHSAGKQFNSTKKGPGRKHKQGKDAQ